MKRNILLIFMYLLFGLNLTAQNLVPNSSFEEYFNCPTSSNQTYLATGWSIRINSPDYYHDCYNGPPPPFPYLYIPDNWFGYQCASNGNAYCGFYLYADSIFSKSWEFIGRQLYIPLIPAQLYYGHL